MRTPALFVGGHVWCAEVASSDAGSLARQSTGGHVSNIAPALLSLAVPIGSLKGDSRNARLHPGPNLDALKRSLTAYGQRKPIVVNADTGQIEAGNGLWQAARDLGWTEIAAVRVKDTPDMAQGYALMDNQSALLSEYDLGILKDILADLDTGAFDMALTGFDEKAIENLMTQFQPPSEGLTDPDAVPAEPQEVYVKPGDIWLCGKHRVMCGDSENRGDVQRLMAGATATAQIYDPEWDKPFVIPLVPERLVFCDGGCLGEAVTQHGSPRWAFTWDCVTSWYVKGQPLRRQKCALWYGSNAYDPDGWHYGEPGQAHEVKNTRGSYHYTPDPRGKHLSDVFVRPLTTEHADGPSHSKPVDWVTLLIANCLPKTGIIHDPFLGSGTTLVACERLERPCYGMEVEPNNAQIAIERWQNFTGQKARREPSPSAGPL